MTALTDLELIEVYKKATYFQLSEEFIHLIEEEISKRRLSLPESIMPEPFSMEDNQSAV